MLKRAVIEFLVGLFMIAGIIALMFLAFQVSGLMQTGSGHYYVVNAEFDNIGNLKTRAPVTIGGVKVGQVGDITLDNQTFRAKVNLLINNKFNNIPTDSTAGILTQGLLGSNYISLTPGFDNTYLQNNSEIVNTRSALILENLIGQFLLSMKGDDKK